MLQLWLGYFLFVFPLSYVLFALFSFAHPYHFFIVLSAENNNCTRRSEELFRLSFFYLLYLFSRVSHKCKIVSHRNLQPIIHLHLSHCMLLKDFTHYREKNRSHLDTYTLLEDYFYFNFPGRELSLVENWPAISPILWNVCH